MREQMSSCPGLDAISYNNTNPLFFHMIASCLLLTVVLSYSPTDATIVKRPWPNHDDLRHKFQCESQTQMTNSWSQNKYLSYVLHQSDPERVYISHFRWQINEFPRVSLMRSHLFCACNVPASSWKLLFSTLKGSEGAACNYGPHDLNDKGLVFHPSLPTLSLNILSWLIQLIHRQELCFHAAGDSCLGFTLI